MATVAVRFVAGRYHATPWGRHVNEGEVDWPPSPWRILRALLAVGFNKLGWTDVPGTAASLVGQLSTTPPLFRLPSGSVGHTRHYMPIRDGRSEKTTKVLDTFLRLHGGAPMLVHFPVELTVDELAVLRDLVAGLGYLGRAESWVEAILIDDLEPDDGWIRPREHRSDKPAPRGWDQISLLTPLTPEGYGQWRDEMVRVALDEVRAAKGKEPTKRDRSRIEAAHPTDLLACLLAETGELQSQGWSQPPGSRHLLYDRPAGLLEPRPLRPPIRRPGERRVEAAVLALASDRPTASVLPQFTRALPQMELIHRSLISILDEDAPNCPVLSGRDPATGEPLRRRHGHAHYIPLDLDEDGRLDHVVVYAPDGLDTLAQRAIRKLRRTWMKGEEHDIVVTLGGFGNLAEVASQLRTRSGRSLAEFSGSRRWSSITPFIPPRFLKKSKHTLGDQVRSELHARGLPYPTRIEVMRGDELVHRRLLRHQRARRDGKPQPAARRAFGLRLRFDEPVQGPIMLGYASHYGLGMFAADGDG